MSDADATVVAVVPMFNCIVARRLQYTELIPQVLLFKENIHMVTVLCKYLKGQVSMA